MQRIQQALIIIIILVTSASISHARDDRLEQANTLNKKLIQLYKQGSYSKAVIIARKVLDIDEKVFGPDHPKITTSLKNLAELYELLGDYDKAKSMYQRSLDIYEKILGPNHTDVAIHLNTIAGLCDLLGDHNKAESLYKRSLDILKKALGPNHPTVATGLNNMALHYDDTGNYAKAEPLLQRSLDIRVKALGPNHTDVAQSLNNLAGLYRSLGNYAKAESLLQRSLNIYEKNLGPDNIDVASILNNLATLYDSLGDYAKAEPLYKRSLDIKEKFLGPDHTDIATILSNLSAIYTSFGNYEKAYPLLQKALDIKVRVLGPNHTDVALVLNNLARLYAALGNYAKAELLYKRSLDINKKVLGLNHTDVALSMNNLAVIYASTNKYQKAHNLFIQAQKIDTEQIDQIMSFTSEKQKLLFLSKKQLDLYGFFSFVNQNKTQITDAPKNALNLWLKRKGIILESQKRFQDVISQSDDPKAIKTFQALAQARSRLSKLTFSNPGNKDIDTYKLEIANIKKNIQVLEIDLNRINQTFALHQKVSKATVKKVADAMPNDTVLIEFAKIKTLNFKARGTEKKWGQSRYLVFVLHAGNEESVGMIDLGDAKKIDHAIFGLKKKTVSSKGSGTKRLSKKLYNLVFAPLKKSIGTVTKIFISPDGNLNLIPFEILQNSDGQYLIENFTFNYLNAGRDLLSFGQIKEKSGKALLIGDPDFNLNTGDKTEILHDLGIDHLGQRYSAKRSSNMRGFNFERLPGTKKEVETIHSLFGEENSRLYIGKSALEEVINQKIPPSIIHLATHGFFLPDPETKDKIIHIKNPLLRSGIALAGANNALKSNNTQESDGIVTAEKILGLRLRGTDMVVLSACETGLGDVKSGEGVYGLRRAFTQAGTKSLVMSMWSVPDKETQELMTEFYKNIVSEKMDRNTALHQAILNEMKITEKRYGENHPFYWGAFVFLGQP